MTIIINDKSHRTSKLYFCLPKIFTASGQYDFVSKKLFIFHFQDQITIIIIQIQCSNVIRQETRVSDFSGRDAAFLIGIEMMVMTTHH